MAEIRGSGEVRMQPKLGLLEDVGLQLGMTLAMNTGSMSEELHRVVTRELKSPDPDRTLAMWSYLDTGAVNDLGKEAVEEVIRRNGEEIARQLAEELERPRPEGLSRIVPVIRIAVESENEAIKGQILKMVGGREGEVYKRLAGLDQPEKDEKEIFFDSELAKGWMQLVATMKKGKEKVTDWISEMIYKPEAVGKTELKKILALVDDGKLRTFVRKRVISPRLVQLGLAPEYFARLAKHNKLYEEEEGNESDPLEVEIANIRSIIELEKLEPRAVQYLHNKWGVACFFRMKPEFFARMYEERERSGKWVVILNSKEDSNGALAGGAWELQTTEVCVEKLWDHGYMVRLMEVESEMEMNYVCNGVKYPQGADGFIINAHGNDGYFWLGPETGNLDKSPRVISTLEIMQGKLGAFDKLLADQAVGVATMCFGGTKDGVARAIAVKVAGGEVHGQTKSGWDSEIEPVFDESGKLVAWQVTWGSDEWFHGGVVFDPKDI